MRINVEGIRQGKTCHEDTYSARELRSLSEEWTFLSPVHIKAVITRMGYEVLVQCEFTTTIEQPCCRCLDPYALRVQTEFQTLFIPEKEPTHPTRRENVRPLPSDEFDRVAVYRGKEIDLSDEIAGAIHLHIPMKPLCRPDCQGICPHCGVNLNESRCACHAKVTRTANNPFLTLKEKFR